MNSNLNHGPAKIYQFPTKARTASASVGYVQATIGSSWYHEEAIRESVRGRRDDVRAKAVIVPLTFPRQ
ncbi:MAG: DUF2735 domain-containing protein [Xanthobacteraceae bacterium]|nr:DUF2735 domain-containing protein [Xanthobacteraceae bacterium]